MNSLVSMVVFVLASTVLLIAATGITTGLTGTVATTSSISKDVTFIEDKIVPNARKVCQDGISRLPEDDEEYLKHQFSGLKEGKLCEDDEGYICLNYGEDNTRKIKLSEACDSYEVDSFDNGLEKFYLKDKDSGVKIKTKN